LYYDFCTPKFYFIVNYYRRYLVRSITASHHPGLKNHFVCFSIVPSSSRRGI
jgi:hypothetical protein